MWCATHVLNLSVYDSLKYIYDAVKNIRNEVKFVKSSPEGLACLKFLQRGRILSVKKWCV